jgi:hypothetical protein
MFFTRLLAQDQKHTFDFVPGFEKSDLKWPKLSSKVITGDGSWWYGYDPETKQAAS